MLQQVLCTYFGSVTVLEQNHSSYHQILQLQLVMNSNCSAGDAEGCDNRGGGDRIWCLNPSVEWDGSCSAGAWVTLTWGLWMPGFQFSGKVFIFNSKNWSLKLSAYSDRRGSYASWLDAIQGRQREREGTGRSPCGLAGHPGCCRRPRRLPMLGLGDPVWQIWGRHGRWGPVCTSLGAEAGAAGGTCRLEQPCGSDQWVCPARTGEAWGCRSQPFPETLSSGSDMHQPRSSGSGSARRRVPHFPTGWIYLLQGLAVRWPPC